MNLAVFKHFSIFQTNLEKESNRPPVNYKLTESTMDTSEVMPRGDMTSEYSIQSYYSLGPYSRALIKDKHASNMKNTSLKLF